jgi:hypothetical protein
MKKTIILFFLFLSTIILDAQRDTSIVSNNFPHNDIYKNSTDLNVSIYPVPIKGNNFTIKSDLEISSVKITNIIGQDIYREQYGNPQQIVNITLSNTKRGMYLITISFSNGTRIVKKIMAEEYE